MFETSRDPFKEAQGTILKDGEDLFEILLMIFKSLGRFLFDKKTRKWEVGF